MERPSDGKQTGRVWRLEMSVTRDREGGPLVGARKADSLIETEKIEEWRMEDLSVGGRVTE